MVASPASVEAHRLFLSSSGRGDFAYDRTEDTLVIRNKNATFDDIVGGLRLDGFPNAEGARQLLTRGKSVIPLSLLQETPSPAPLVPLESLPRAAPQPVDPPHAPLAALKAPGLYAVRDTDFIGIRAALNVRPGQEGQLQDVLHTKREMKRTFRRGGPDGLLGPESRDAFYAVMAASGCGEAEVNRRLKAGESALDMAKYAVDHPDFNP